MLAVRKLVNSTAVNAVCVLRLEDGSSVTLAAMSESVHVFDLYPSAATAPAFSSSTPSSSASSSPPFGFHPRGHVFHVGCGISGLLALTNQCFLIWTRDQECLLVRYQANLTSALTDARVTPDNDRVYRGSGEPSPVHYKEHHWYVVHSARLWCPESGTPVHPPEMGVNDSMETAHIRFCRCHIFLVSIKWHPACMPCSGAGSGGAATGAGAAGTASASGAAATPPGAPSLRTSRWHSGDYMRFFAGTGFHYPTQSCSAAMRRPGEDAVAHQQRMEELWQSGSPFANVPDEDLIATHAVGELSQRKSSESQIHHSPTSATTAGAQASGRSPTAVPAIASRPEKADWCGVRTVWVRRESYSALSPLMPSPTAYCAGQQGGFANVREGTGHALAVHHAPSDLCGSRSTPIKDDRAAERVSGVAVAAPRRAGRRGAMEWTLMAFLSSPQHTAVYHLQRPRTPLGTSHFALDGLFYGAPSVAQVLMCGHSGDVANDVWAVLSTGALTRFSVAELRARGSDAAAAARNPELYQWPSVFITGLPQAFFCRRMVPADHLVRSARQAGKQEFTDSAYHCGSDGEAPPSVYPYTKRYALLSDAVQDVHLVDLVERRVVASMAGDGPMTDVCDAPHGYVTAFARGKLRYYQPGVQLHLRGSAALPPAGVPIHFIRATRIRSRAPPPPCSTVNSSQLPFSEMRIEAGVYVMISTQQHSQLYRVEDANMAAWASPAWPYVRDEATLGFEAIEVRDKAAGAEGGTRSSFVQCTPSQWVFDKTVHKLPCTVSHAKVALVPLVGPVCVAVCEPSDLASSTLLVATGAGICAVDVSRSSVGVPLGLPSCVTLRGLRRGEMSKSAEEGEERSSSVTGAIQVLVGRFDGHITVLTLQLTGPSTSSTQWHCVAAQAIQNASCSSSPVQQFLCLPPAGSQARWMTAHPNGEVAILSLGTNAESQLAYSWAATASPAGRVQQKVTCALAPLVRAALPRASAGASDTTEVEEEEEAEVYNGFDGALLQPRDTALLFFTVPLEKGDTQAPPHMRRLRESDEEDREWAIKVENTVRAVVPPDTTEQAREGPWQCAVIIESFTCDGTLRYDALVVQHGGVTMYTLDSHLFTPTHRLHRARHTLTGAIAANAPSDSITVAAAAVGSSLAPVRAYTLASTAPSRYVCTNELQLPHMHPQETLLSIDREPDDEGEGILLCVSVCDITRTTRLTTLHSGTLAVLNSLVLTDEMAHWMAAVPPSTPSIARTAPLFLLCSENMLDGTVQLQVVAADPLHIVSCVTLEEPPVWAEVAAHGVTIDGAVQVVPARITGDGHMCGGEVLVTVVVDYAIHLFVLCNYSLLFQHCVLAPACATSVTLCYPIVSVCTQGDTSVYLQVYPVNDDTEVLAPAYSTGSSQPLRKFGKVSWKMRVAVREPSSGACVLAQLPLYDRCVRTDVEGGLSVTFVSLFSKTSSLLRGRGEDAYIGSAEGPQAFLTHAVRLPTVAVKTRGLRHVSPVQRRFPRQLQLDGHVFHLQSCSRRRDESSRMVMLPCHDGSLYGAFELPYGFAHPLLRLEQAITDAYALDLSLSLNPAYPAVLQHTYHLRPFHQVTALQPLVGTEQTGKMACVMVDAFFEYLVLRELNSRACDAASATDSEHAPSSESPTAVVRRKYAALDDLVQTLLTEEYGEECTVDMCAEMLTLP